MKTTIETTVAADEASVSRLAYQLWENAGRPSGRDLEFWLAAEAQLRAVAHPSAPVAAQQAKVVKAPRVGSNGKKTWPKPYPPLPKF